MRVCFTSDLHGSMALYEQLGGLVRAEPLGLLVLGGDLVEDLDRSAPLGPQIAAVRERVMGWVEGWREARPSLAVACVGGNHELAAMRAAFRPFHHAGRITLLDHRRAWRCGGLAWLGYSHAPPSPHWAKDYERLDRRGDAIPNFPGQVWDPTTDALRDVDAQTHFGREPTIEEDLAESPMIAEPWVLVSHAPPHGTRLDRLPGLARPLGSQAIRAFIETRRPVLSLHGHFHDSPELTGDYRDQVGATLSVNPGQGTSRLHAVLFDTSDPPGTLRHTVFA
jgi:Icc-related predicted phosphoesterase